MFKLKPGNVFQKLNQMDRKQAYTLGAIVLVCFVALTTLASFMGNADESSFEDYNTRGYDLAQMPFLNDEAEEYLLASKYPDMQGNNSTMLYSAAEKEARQQEDAAAEAAEEETDDSSADLNSSYASSGSGGYGRGYSGRAPAAPTVVGKLGSASMSTASGRGVSATWGAPSGDFSPYKTQEKGTEGPIQFKNQDARRALAQFSQGSRAAAGYRDSKGANAKRALMGANVAGSDAFTKDGVDLSKTGGLAIDTNAPISSSDLGNIEDKVAEAAQDAKDKKNEFENAEKDFWQQLGEQLLSGLVNKVVDAGGKVLDQQVGNWMANWNANSAFHEEIDKYVGGLYSKPLSELTADDIQVLQQTRGTDNKGNAIDWAGLQQKAKDNGGGGSVGETWLATDSGAQAPKNGQKTFLKGNANDAKIDDYVESMNNHPATIHAEEVRDAERNVQLGRTGSNVISRALKDAPDAPGGKTSTSSTGSSHKCPAGQTWTCVTQTEPGGYSTTETCSCK